MFRWPAVDRTEVLSNGASPFGLANQMLADLKNYDFDTKRVSNYAQAVRDDIERSIVDLRRIPDIRARLILRPTEGTIRREAVVSQDALVRDQAVWQLAVLFPENAAGTIMESIRTAPTRRLMVSALIALQKVANRAPAEVSEFLSIFQKETEVEVAEWCRVLQRDIAASAEGKLESLGEAASEREFVHDSSRLFDVTMPLMFAGDAYTSVGPTTWHTVFSPEWFRVVFGGAMALIQQHSFHSKLILEKDLPGIHEDGSMHYEHFPFSGDTQALGHGLYRHNYWANLYRPFYPAGRLEKVTDAKPAIRSVPMSFFRAAVTAAPKRYWLNEKPIPESVRGMYFGYGHVDPGMLTQNLFELRAGDFQLTPSRNPETGKPANTIFCGTFFGKLTDVNGDGKLDVNTIPTHCDAQGMLDYNGDGTMAPDPACPLDWTGLPATR